MKTFIQVAQMFRLRDPVISIMPRRFRREVVTNTLIGRIIMNLIAKIDYQRFRFLPGTEDVWVYECAGLLLFCANEPKGPVCQIWKDSPENRAYLVANAKPIV